MNEHDIDSPDWDDLFDALAAIDAPPPPPDAPKPPPSPDIAEGEGAILVWTDDGWEWVAVPAT